MNKNINKNIENITNDFEVEHLFITPDGTPHYHNYIEIELIEHGDGIQIINGQKYEIENHSISILRPYIDHQSFIPKGVQRFCHNINFKENQSYNIVCGAIHITSGINKDKIYLFLKIDGKIISEKFISENFDCQNLSFFAKYTTKNIEISESENTKLDFSDSKILASDDVMAYYDFSSNINLNMPEKFILDQEDLSFHTYNRSDKNIYGSFVYSCNIKVETIGYRIITFKLNDKNKEINFLLANDEIYISQRSPENEFRLYKLCVNPSIIDSEVQKKLTSFNNPLCSLLPDETYKNVKRIFEILIFFSKNYNVYDKEIIALVNILVKLYLNTIGKEENADPLKKTVLTYFIDNNHFLDEISLEDFAEYLGYESGYASRLCLKYTGYSFAKYKNHLRLQYAKHLISSTNIPIAEISIKSGFNSLSVFNRFFKKETGHSPSIYRSMHK